MGVGPSHAWTILSDCRASYRFPWNNYDTSVFRCKLELVVAKNESEERPNNTNILLTFLCTAGTLTIEDEHERIR